VVECLHSKCDALSSKPNTAKKKEEEEEEEMIWCWAWWHTLGRTALGRLMQEDVEFHANLGYM
jgi:hypothetical protein